MSFTRISVNRYETSVDSTHVILFRDQITRTWGFKFGEYTVDGFARRVEAQTALTMVMNT